YAAYVVNMLSNLLNEQAFSSHTASLMKKAWEAFPEDRQNLLRVLWRADASQMPEMEGYLREAMIPDSASFQPLNQWYNSFQIASCGGNGRTTPMTAMFLNATAAKGRLEQAKSRIDAARKSLPAWSAGEVLGALVDCRLGRYDEPRRGIGPLLEKTAD